MCAASIVHSLPEKQDKIGKLHLCLHGYRRRRAGITQSKKPSSSLPEQGEKKTAFFVCSISIVRLGFCMNNFLVLLTLRVRLTGLHS